MRVTTSQLETQHNPATAKVMMETRAKQWKQKGKVFANLKLSKTKPYETKLRNQAIQSSNHEKQVTRQVEKRRESHSKVTDRKGSDKLLCNTRNPMFSL